VHSIGRDIKRVRHGLSRLIIWPYTNDAATEYGRVFAELRRIGRPMQEIDIMIAAIAISFGNCIVVSDDSELHAVPGLVVESWTSAAPGSGLPIQVEIAPAQRSSTLMISKKRPAACPGSRRVRRDAHCPTKQKTRPPTRGPGTARENDACS
jgi:hypothetical protein